MIRRLLGFSRYIVLIPIIGAFIAAVALMVHEAIVVGVIVFNAIREGSLSARAGKDLAVGVLEAVDVFLISIVAYIISLGLYTLFIDNSLRLPRWLRIHNLDDLKNHLVRLVVAVLAVLFLREAVARAGDLDLLKLAAALALVVAALTFFLAIRGAGRH
jgi:uncharacterized membrane protein YqhA